MAENSNHIPAAFLPGLRAQFSRYRRSTVARNAASLYLIQFANSILPLITVPYVVRVLMPHGYGQERLGWKSFAA